MRPVWRIMLIMGCVSLFAAVNAQAVTLIAGTPLTHPWQRWANESQMPQANVPVHFAEFSGYGPCGGQAGCARWDTFADASGRVTFSNYTATITRNADPGSLHHYLWHELTHVFDGAAMTNQYRAEFMAAWGLSGGPDRWWMILPGTYGGSPAEWFAEAGALCSAHGVNIGRLDLPVTSGDFRTYHFPGWDNVAALARSCRIIVAAGQAAGLPVPAQRTYRKALPSRKP